MNTTERETVEFLYLDQESVVEAGALDPRFMMELVEEAYALKDDGEAIEPPPIKIDLDDSRNRRLVAHAGWVGGDVARGGVKWIPAAVENPVVRAIPRACAMVILTDPESALPLAIMEGSVISAMRTAASTGVAVKHLAVPQVSEVGLLGAGVANRSQLLMLRHLCPEIRNVRVFDSAPDRAARWAAEEQAKTGLPITPVTTASEAVRGCHVVVAATRDFGEMDGYVEPAWLDAGCLFVGVSAADAKLEVLRDVDVVVAAEREALDRPGTLLGAARGRGMISPEGVVDLGAIVTGRTTGRHGDEDRIYVDAYGLGILDVIAAHGIYERASADGFGRRLPLWSTPLWV